MVLAVGVATCKINDLVVSPEGAIINVEPVNPTSLKDSSAFGSTAPTLGPIKITNEGGGELHWRARVKNASPWVTLDPDTGTVGQTPMLQVVFNPSGLDSIVYQDTVVVEDRGGSGSLETPLWYKIYSCKTTPIRLDDSVTTSLTTADCGALHKPRGWFTRLFQINNGTVDDSLTIDVTAAYDAFVAFDTSLNAAAAPFKQSDTCLGVGSDPCLYYQKLPRNGIYYVEVTSADSADTGAFKVRVLHPRLPNLPDSLDQRVATDSTTPVPPGGAIAQLSIVLRAVISDPDLGDTLRLQAEVQPTGTAFTGNPTVTGGPVRNGSPAYAVQLVADTKSYHWQVRALDQTGRASNWKAFSADPAFTVQAGHDPNAPSPNQYQSDGTTLIPAGGNTTTQTVVFKSVLNDPDVGDSLVLQVEVEPVGVNFDSTTNTAQSALVARGSTASVTVAGLTVGASYHWQYRAVDKGGRHTAWTSFGGNAENLADFQVTLVPTQNLNWVIQPAVDTAGRPIRGAGQAAIQVAFQDQNGNTITSFNGPVTMAISFNPSGGTLSGTNPVNAVAGVATFPDLSINKAGTGYKLRATTGTINSVESAPFNVVAAPVTQVVFTAQPMNATAGAVIAPPIQVSGEDQFGNVNSSFTGAVVMTIAANPGVPPGTLSGLTNVSAVNGVATFSNLSINKSGVGYTLRASSGALIPDTSALFNIVAGPLAHLTFTVPPTGAPANAVFVPPVQVSGQDANDNLVSSFAGNVTVGITTGTGTAGAILSGLPTRTAVGGVATFPDLSIDKVGTGYTLTATAASVTGASPAFNITPPTVDAAKSTVVANPATITACNTGCSVAASTASTITVTARDAGGFVVPNVPASITVTGTGNNGVTGTVNTNASGVATWTLNSTVASATPAELKNVSAVINSVPITQKDTVTVIPGPAASLGFTTQPTNTTAGVAINSPGNVVVTAKDQFGNTATSFNSQLTMTLGASPAGGVLSGTVTATPNAGVANFGNLRIKKAGTGYQLSASGGSLTTNPLSSAFAITTAPLIKLGFVVEPGTTVDSAPITPNPQVAGQDSVNNTVTSFTGSVRMFLQSTGTNPGGGTLSGTTQVTAATGVATFTNLRINALGTGYSLLATSTGLVSDTSVSFNIITGPAAKLGITTAPSSSAQSGVAFAQQPVIQVQDAQGNPVSQGGTVITATFASGTGSLNNPNATTNASGTATFAGLAITGLAGNYTLSFGTTGLTSVTSGTIALSAGAPAKLGFGQQPTSTNAAATISPPVTVRILDAGGNLTSSTANVTVSITPGTGTTGAHLSGGASVTAAAVGGVATFGTLSIDSVGTGYTLNAASGVLTGTTSTAFDITAGAPAKLAFGQQPTSTTGGATIAPPVTVRILDAGGNLTSSTANVTLAISPGTGTTGAHLSGGATVTVAAVGGIATFSTLNVDSAGSGYTLNATSGALTGATSSVFNINVGAANKLAFGQQPTATTGGATIAPPVTVRILDAGGNLTASTANVTLAISSGTGTTGAHLSGGASVTVAASGGTATFSTLNIDSAGTGYTLRATSGALTVATSSAFNINVGAANKLAFGQQPTTTTGGATIAPPVTVRILDAGGNLTASTANVTLAISSGTGTTGAHLSGSASVTVAASGGTATFSTLNIDSAGTGYTLRATSGALTVATSNTFDINVGVAAKLAFDQQPTDANVDATITPAVTVRILDAGGNLVTTATNMVSLTLSPNPPSLTGGDPIAAINGVATFAGLSVSNAGGYTLGASSGSLTGATSASFNIN